MSSHQQCCGARETGLMGPYDVLSNRHTTHNTNDYRLRWLSLRFCLRFKKLSRGVFTNSIYTVCLILCFQNALNTALNICQDGNVVAMLARSITWPYKSPRLPKSHISISAMLDNGVCSVFSHRKLISYSFLVCVVFEPCSAFAKPLLCTFLFFTYTLCLLITLWLQCYLWCLL